MKAPKNFMTFPYNIFKKATISSIDVENGEITITLKVEDTWLFKKIKQWLQEESEE